MYCLLTAGVLSILQFAVDGFESFSDASLARRVEAFVLEPCLRHMEGAGVKHLQRGRIEEARHVLQMHAAARIMHLACRSALPVRLVAATQPEIYSKSPRFPIRGATSCVRDVAARVEPINARLNRYPLLEGQLIRLVGGACLAAELGEIKVSQSAPVHTDIEHTILEESAILFVNADLSDGLRDEEGAALASLVFELMNVANRQGFTTLDGMARSGQLSRRQYVEQCTFLEQIAALRTQIWGLKRNACFRLEDHGKTDLRAWWIPFTRAFYEITRG